MKKLFVLGLSIVLFSYCSKSGGVSSSSSITLNPTEKQLVGYWKLEKAVDSFNHTEDGITSPGFPQINTMAGSSSHYLELKDTKSGNNTTMEAKYKDATNSLNGGAAPSYWYYEEGTNQLVLLGSSNEVLSLTTNSLTIRYIMTSTMSGTSYTYRDITFYLKR